MDQKLSRREREIMDVLFRLESASVSEVLDNLASPPGYSAVRATMRILEEKGQVTHRKDGRRFVYEPVTSRSKAGRSALDHIISTFFDGSPESVVATLLDIRRDELSQEQIDRIQDLIDKAREEED